MKLMSKLTGIILFFIISTIVSDAQAGLFNAKYLQEQRVKKEAYFKDSNNKLMILIDQLSNTEASALFELSISMLEESGTKADTSQKQTPFVVTQDFNEPVETFLKEYAATSELERQAMLPLIDLKTPSMSIIASTACHNGLKIEVYFNGELIASDSNDSDYPSVSAGFHIPIAKAVKNIYESRIQSGALHR